MTRFTGAAATSAAAYNQLQYRQFVDLGVTSSTIYACTGNQFITASATNNPTANTYSPVGELGGIEPIGDQADVQPATVRLWLQAVGSADFYEPVREDMFNRPVVIHHGYLDPVTDTLVSTPEVQWKGFINKVEVHIDDPERGNFFEVEAETALRRKAEVTNFTKESHWTTLGQSGDTFFSYIHQVPIVKALWGNQATTFNGQSPGRWVSPLPGRVPFRWRPQG